MTPCIKFILCFLPVIGFSQVVDFENLPNLNPEDPVGVITLVEEDYNIQFYMGHSIQETIPLILKRVAHNSGPGGFYGAESHLDCEGKTIETMSINQINAVNFALNPEITNRERVGCHFISGILLDEVLPSIFIFYDKPVLGCSADLLDVDGHDIRPIHKSSLWHNHPPVFLFAQFLYFHDNRYMSNHKNRLHNLSCF